MNRIYRLVWNQSLGCYVVASELARSRIKTSVTGAVKSYAILSMLISFGMTWPSLSIADVISATTATQVYDSPNGVPVVDIATANANGLSHNTFNQYNVDSKGLVLNNNANLVTAVQSQLAGQVQANLNLNNAASVILNEVVSANRSTLAGYTEVAGTKADVIVANPWGITCSGCGFINTDRVTLSTGTPIFNNGNLTGFDVKQGDVLVNGTGADLSAQKMFDVVARSIKLDGQVNAGDLKLVAGSNEWDYSSRTATATTPKGTAPAYAIDSTMLGGMYAGRVELIANEAGVGVRMMGDVAASVGSFTLTADGKIELNNQVSAQQNIVLTSTDNAADAITLTDTSLTANKNIELTATSGGATIAGGVFKATETLSYQVASLDDAATASAIDDNNKRYANTVDINTTGAASIDAVSYGAASSLNIDADSLDLGTGSTALYTDNGPLAINVTGDMALGNASVKSANGLTLSSTSGLISTGSATNQGIQATAGDITITASSDGLDNQGVISADTGALNIVSHTPATVTLDNSGTLYGRTSIKLGDSINNSWLLAINNSGLILSDDELNVIAGTINNNTSGTLQGLGSTTIEADFITNDGLLFASNTSGSIKAFQITNNADGVFQSGGDLTVETYYLLNNANKILATGNLNITGIGTGTPSFINVEGAAGFIQSGALLNISGFDTLDLTRGTIFLGDTLQITADSLTVAGGARVQSTGAMVLDLNRLVMPESDSVILAGGSSFINLTQDLNNYGVIHSTDRLLINSTVATPADINIQATGAISAINYLNIKSNDFNNWGTVYTANEFIAYSYNDFINYASGEIDSGGSIEIAATYHFINNNNIVAAGDIAISGPNFNNEIVGGDTRYWDGVEYNISGTDTGWADPCDPGNPASFLCIGVDQDRDYSRTWTEKQQYSGLVPTDADRPQITSTGGDITIANFISGLNLAGIISANNITLSPSAGGGTFTNDDYSLQEDTNVETWHDEIRWDGLSATIYYYIINTTTDLYGGIATTSTFTSTLSSSGLYASGTLTADSSNLNLVNVGALINTGSAPADSVTATTDPDAETPTTASSAITFGGLNLTLPINPNGVFIVSQNPASKYLVETNPLYQVGSGFGGSDFFINRYGYDPELLQKRLGDASYEAYLIRQQLIAQTGNNLLDGYQQEEVLLQSLMEQGADEAERLGFVWGESLTKEQLAKLDTDIVWMVEVTVNGEKVLAPQVFLSQATKDKILTGAVLAAGTIDLNVGSLTNIGGVIVAEDDLTVTAVNDITNTSGTIKGADVALTSTDGSIINQTWSETSGDVGNTVTNIGKTGSIESTGELSLTAKQDIKIIGADLAAAGDASLSAGNDIVIDTIVDKKSDRTSSNSDASYNSTTTTTETNIGSTLDIGGNLNLNSVNDTTIAGSDVSIDGDLVVTTGGDFNVIARQDKVTTNTLQSESGTDGGIINRITTTTDKFLGTNKGATLDVGENASIDSEGKFVIQGSSVDIAGNADIDATAGIEVLNGLDEETTTTVTKTFTLLAVEGDAESSSASDSSASSEDLAADATASANASAESNHDVILEQKATTTTNAGSKTSVASNLNIGGDLNATTDADLTIQGSNVDVGGNAKLDAENVNVLTGQTETWSNTVVNSTSVGIFEESNANVNSTAEADAQSYGALATNASASATANASADSDVTIGVRVEQENSSDYSLTNTSSKISIGGDLSIKAKDTATFVGADVESTGDLSIDASNINNLAARDVTESSTSNNSDTAGIYLSGEAEAVASAESNAQTGILTNADGSASASAEAEAGAGVRYNNQTGSSTDGTSTVVGNTFKSGGDFSRTAEDTIVDQATEVEAGGDIDQSARVIRDEAVHDETYSTSNTTEDDVRLGVYAGAKVDAGADAGGLSGASADAGAEAGAGVQAQYENEYTDSTSETKTAVTSKFKSGGNINSYSEESTTLVGTEFDAGGDVNIEAESLDYQAAQDSTSSTSRSSNVSADGKVAIYGSTGAKLDVEYDAGENSEATTTARTGSISAAGNLNIKTTGDATFVGTDLEAGDKASIDAGGDVDFQAARNTTSSSSDSTNAGASLSATKKDDSVGISGGYDETNSESSTAVVGTIKSGDGGTSIKSGGDTSLEGTQLLSDGATSIDAGGDVNLKAATNTSSEDTAGASADIGLSEGSAEGVLEGGYTDVGSTNSTTTSIQSAGDISIKGNTITNQEADIQSTTGNETMTGEVVNIEAEDSDYATGIELRLKSTGGDSSKKNSGTDTSSTSTRSDAISDTTTNNNLSSDSVSQSTDSVTSKPDTPLVKDSSADNPNPNSDYIGAEQATSNDATDPNLSDTGSDETKSDDTANPNSNDSGADQAPSDDATDPNPSDTGSEESKSDESVDPIDSDVVETKSDDTADLNPNDGGAEQARSDGATDPNPGDTGSEESKSDESVDPIDSDVVETKSDDTANPNGTDSAESKSDDTADPNPNDGGADQAPSDEATDPNPSDTGSEESKSDESVEPIDSDVVETKSDDTANPNGTDSAESKSDDTANPNPNDSGADQAPSDEATDPNPSDTGSEESKSDESVEPIDSDVVETKSDDTANPNGTDSAESKSDETANPNPNDSGADQAPSDEATDPNPSDTGSEESKSDESVDPIDSDVVETKSDDTANPNGTDSAESKSDETADLIDEVSTTEDGDHALRALHRVQKNVPGVENCVEQTMENGQTECISVE
jgi:filamentous hemagglutinin